MRMIALLLLTSLSGTSVCAQPALVRALPEFVYRPVPANAYRWKIAQPAGNEITIGNALATKDDSMWSFGGYDTVNLQRGLFRLAGGRPRNEILPPYPGEGFMYNIFFARDSFLFIGGGRDSGIARYSSRDFWRYDLRTAEWQRLHDLPFYYAAPPFLFSWNGEDHALISVLQGEQFETSLPTVYRYDAVADNWLPLESAGLMPILRSPHAFLLDEDLYVLFSDMRVGFPWSNPFFAFNLRSHTWKKRAPFPGVARTFAFAFTDGRYGFAGGGIGRAAGNLRDVYRYDPGGDQWEKIRNVPLGIRHGQSWMQNGKRYLGFGIVDGDHPAPVFEFLGP